MHYVTKFDGMSPTRTLLEVSFSRLFSGETACEISRSYQSPKFGIPDTKVAIHAGIHFYVDKELMVGRRRDFNTLRLGPIF